MTMLDRMRRHKGWLKWTLGLVVLAFVIFFIPQDFLQPGATVGFRTGDVVAEVEGRELTAGEFQRRYFLQVQAYRSQLGGSISDQLLRQLGVEQQVLRQMIDEQVALVEAERHDIGVSDDELAEQVLSIPGLTENGQFIGEARYAQLLQSQNPPMTPAEFESNLRRGLIVDKLRAALTDWMAVSDAEVEQEYRRRNEKVKLQIVALTAERFRTRVSPTDADVAAYFEAYASDYRVGEQRKIRYLLLDRDQERLQVSVPPGDIQRYYDDNLQQFTTPEQVKASHMLFKTDGRNDAQVRARAEAVLKQVQSGADFAALARKVSEDDATKEKGGDLDYFGRNQMVPEFEAAAFAMTPGQTSDLVKSPYGFHIIKVVDKREETRRPLDQVRAQIQAQLASEIADQRVTDRARELDGRIEDAGDLEDAAAELGLKLQESGLFQRADPVPGLGPAPEVAAAAFTLNGAEASGAVASPRGPLFLTVIERRDPYVPKLDEVRSRVREAVIRARAADLGRARAAEVAPALKSARDFAAAAKAQKLEVKDTELVARESVLPDVGLSPAVDKVAFALPAGAVSDPISTRDGAVIVRIVERDDVTMDEYRQAREQFRAELLNERRERFFNAYMNKVRARLAIEIRDDVLRRITDAWRL
jgi:peptidyl-prolyl cis-trans isomerase D